MKLVRRILHPIFLISTPSYITELAFVNITRESSAQIEQVNETPVALALKAMKANKHDSLFDIVSDCLINGPCELIFHLTKLLRLFVSHGSVPTFVLICTLMPMVKDNLGNITHSDNYRAIAGGSLLLKLLDFLILQLKEIS